VRVSRAKASVFVGPARIGQGLFAAKNFKTNQTILKIVGRVVGADVLWKRRGSTFSANCYRFGPETYLDPGEHASRYVNHSCAPNAGVGKSNNQLFLFAATPIKTGQEIVFDYSTILGDDDIWMMRCKCDRPTCRRTIRRFGSLSPVVKEDYLRRGLVPQFIIRTLL
jgi:hypothetical protein